MKRENGTKTPSVVVTADFATPADYPLSKTRFAGFNSGMVPLAHYQRDIALFDEVHPHSLRIDLGWGPRWAGWAKQPVAGTIENILYDFNEMDQIAALLNEHNVLPYWSYCYMPAPLQENPGNYRSKPSDVAVWGEVLGTFARHHRESCPANPVGYHEVYNEPDNRDFLHATDREYIAMYHQSVLKIRDADPDAVVGGPALAFRDEWVAPFLKYVAEHRLPLDFFSFHYYPTHSTNYYQGASEPANGAKSVASVIEAMRQQLAKYPEFSMTEMHLNEYNSYPIDYPKGGRQDKYPLASELLHNYLYFLSQPDLTQVHWAQFMDSGGGNFSGMISIEGHRKAVFNAYRIYAMMPVDRCQVSIHGTTAAEGMASADGHKVSLVLWSNSGSDQTVNVALNGVPFARGHFRVYRIDSDHANWGDNPENEELLPMETLTGIPTDPFTWSGPLPKGGVLYLEVEDGTGISELAPNRVAKVIHVLRYFPNRKTSSYADFDRNTWIARLGMAVEQEAHEQIGVVAEALPPRLTVSIQTDGMLCRLDGNSLLGVRLDYQVGDSYAKSVLFHGPCNGSIDLYAPSRNAPMPWGTKRQADQLVTVPDLASFDIAPGDYAPADWTQRMQFTFIMQNTGPGTRAKIKMISD